MQLCGCLQKRKPLAAFGWLLISPSKYLYCLVKSTLGLCCTSPMFQSFLLDSSVFLSLVCRPCLEIGSLSESPSHHKFMVPFNSHSGQYRPGVCPFILILPSVFLEIAWVECCKTQEERNRNRESGWGGGLNVKMGFVVMLFCKYGSRAVSGPWKFYTTLPERETTGR